MVITNLRDIGNIEIEGPRLFPLSSSLMSKTACADLPLRNYSLIHLGQRRSKPYIHLMTGITSV